MPDIPAPGSAQLAEIVAGQIAELLIVPVVVLDDQGQVRAASQERGGGAAPSPAYLARDPLTIRVPFASSGQSGEVLLGASPDGKAPSLDVARIVVEQAIRYALLVQEQPNRQDLRNQFLHDLLAGRMQDETAIRRRGGMVGLHFAQAYAVLILDAAGYLFASPFGTREETNEARIRQRVQVVLSHLASFFRQPGAGLYLYIGAGEFAVLPAIRPGGHRTSAAPAEGAAVPPGSWGELDSLKATARVLLLQLRPAIQGPLSLGVGRYHPGLLGLARSYREAGFVLETGRRLQGPDQIHSLDTLGAGAFVATAEDWMKAELAARLLAPLDEEPVLRQTLAAFFAGGGAIDHTALGLGIHRNTLRQRLDRVQTLTGLNPRHLDDALQIRCAILHSELSYAP